MSCRNKRRDSVSRLVNAAALKPMKLDLLNSTLLVALQFVVGCSASHQVLASVDASDGVDAGGVDASGINESGALGAIQACSPDYGVAARAPHSPLQVLTERCALVDGALVISLQHGDLAVLAVDAAGGLEINGRSCAGANLHSLSSFRVVEDSRLPGSEKLVVAFCGALRSGDAALSVDLGPPSIANLDRLVVVGSSADEQMHLGGAGMRWGESLGANILWPRLAGLEVSFLLQDGDDFFDATGGEELGGPFNWSTTIFGGPGNDTIRPGLGSDSVWGDAGDDTFVALADYDGNDTFVGGEGTDVADYSARTVGVQIDARAEYDRRGTVIGYDDGSIELGENDWIGHDQEDVESLIGGSSNDVLIAATGPGSLVGNDGDDWLEAGLGAHMLSGGPGQDSVSYQDRHDAVAVVIDNLPNDGEVREGDFVRDDIERVYGGGGDDRLEGTDANDWLHGGGGADTLIGHGGDDTMHGDNGPDLFVADGILDGSDLCEGGEDADSVYYTDRTSDLTIALSSTEPLSGESGEGDTLLSIENAWAGNGDDTVLGNNKGNVLLGGSGDDTLRGFGGDDTVMGEEGDDSISCGEGSDVCSDPDGEASCPRDCDI